MTTASPARTDVHRPTALVTEDYEYVLSYDAHPEEGDRRHVAEYIARTGRTFGENHSAGSCFHCGARMRYIAVLLHTPTDTLIKVGETCLANRFELATADFHRLRKAAELNRAQMKVRAARRQWFAVNEDREVAFQWATERVNAGDYGYDGMRHSFVHKINRYGSTSDKFVRAMMRDMARTERFEDERAAQDAAEAATAAPVVTGRVVITGEILSVKWRENDFGGSLKMTVRDDRGFKVWGSVPASIDTVEKGQRVEFTATVEASSDDPTFGFVKRPSKARVL